MLAGAIAVGVSAAAVPSADAATTTITTTATAHTATHSTFRPQVIPLAGVTDTTICAHTNTAYCVDVVGDSNTSGTKVWLYPNGADDHWNFIPVTCSTGASAACYYIEDSQNTKLCLSATGTQGQNIVLRNCSTIGAWYDDGSYILGNDAYGAGGELDAQAIGTHDYLYSYGAGNYRQFTVLHWN